ncbi:MAG: choice-of-anchor tandem repeat GloVer-containing protein [Candidatus Cybelea sp.]
MRISTSILVAAFFSAALLAACGGNSPSSSTPMSVTPQIAAPLSQSPTGVMAERTHVRPAYSVLYSFKGGSDGEYPWAGLLNANGTLYGTTGYGGSKHKGTVFKITTSGNETVLYRFKGGAVDGENPYASLINVKGTFYGTTRRGGGGCEHHFCGTVFSITPSGMETVLHSFDGGRGNPDGAFPEASLINVKSTLYGTTLSAGPEAYGTVFSVTTSGTETVLHGFSGIGSGDGAFPYARLLNIKDTLYGTTREGSATNEGIVFSVTLSGSETVLYNFAGGSDGASPWAGLINVNGTLYGTTRGGGSGCGGYGCGTVFAITTSGKEMVLHRFGGSSDGALPTADLLNINGTLYGTTQGGGANNDGTVFSITTSGTETVLHSFGTGTGDGQNPYAGLINVNGTLYGTTTSGGSGYGTVFSFSP